MTPLTDCRPRTDRNDRRPHVAVIGAGVGGLAAAIRLGAKGYRVTVLERLDAPGGRAYTYRQDGFTFDAGPTIITAPYIFEELWTLCGKRMADHVELRPCDPFYRIRFDDGAHFTYSGDQAAMRAEVARMSPGDVDGYDRFLRASGEIYKVAFEQLADKPFHSLGFTLRAAADLVRLRGYRSVYSRVSGFFRNEHLRTVFSFHPLLIGGNPFTTTSYYCLIAHLESKFGVHYAVGGTGALVRGMVGSDRAQGGTSAAMPRSTGSVRDGRAAGVLLASGEEIAADVVVSNAEPAWTYGKLLRDHPRRRWTDASWPAPAFHGAGGLVLRHQSPLRRRPAPQHDLRAALPRLARRYLPSAEAGRRLQPVPAPANRERPVAGAAGLRRVLRAGARAQPGERHRLGRARPSATARSIQQRLESTLLPGLGRSIVTSRMLTPQDFRDRYLSLYGAGFAMEPRLLQSAWFRPHNLSEEVEGLYLVGAGTHPGRGPARRGVVGARRGFAAAARQRVRARSLEAPGPAPRTRPRAGRTAWPSARPGPGCTEPPAKYRPGTRLRAPGRAKVAKGPCVARPYSAPPVAGNNRSNSVGSVTTAGAARSSSSPQARSRPKLRCSTAAISSGDGGCGRRPAAHSPAPASVRVAADPASPSRDPARRHRRWAPS